MTLRILSAQDRTALAGLYRKGWEVSPDVSAGVSSILDGVRRFGDDALVTYTHKFDCETFDAGDIRADIPPLEQTRAALPSTVAQALELAAERIRAFHERQLPQTVSYTETDGTRYAFGFEPLASAGCYVPGGSAVLPSSVLMNVLPAKVAGVERVAAFTPVQHDGTISPAILFACALSGVDELYAVGGAQAIAAAAFGTQRVRPVDKITGPGNVWVTEAKRQVFGVCGIDSLAGPSEILVVADASADEGFVAAELLAQAEHDPQARVAAVSTDRAVLEGCMRLLQSYGGERAAIVSAVLERSAYLIHARDEAEVLDVIASFAPEHLSLQVRDADAWLPRIRNAGAVFCGPKTPVAWGDYIAGTNHVLPTSGAARYASGLRTIDFMRSFSVLENSAERARGDAPLVSALARYEGLANHARSAERLRA